MQRTKLHSIRSPRRRRRVVSEACRGRAPSTRWKASTTGHATKPPRICHIRVRQWKINNCAQTAP